MKLFFLVIIVPLDVEHSLDFLDTVVEPYNATLSVRQFVHNADKNLIILTFHSQER